MHKVSINDITTFLYSLGKIEMHKVKILKKRCLDFPDIANADDNPMSRRKSLKKSLRESFRRLRKGRSQRNIDKKKNTTGNTTSDPIKKELPKYRYIFEINPNFDLIKATFIYFIC